MSAYWIARVDVKDADTYAKYAKVATQAVSEFGGRFLARGGHFEPLEGVARARNVIAEFPSMESALACYRSQTYAKALEYARVSAERELVRVEGAWSAVSKGCGLLSPHTQR